MELISDEILKDKEKAYERFVDDPATLRSPPHTVAEEEIQLKRRIDDVNKTPQIHADDLIADVASIDEATRNVIADEAVHVATSLSPTAKIACIACPGIYFSLRESFPDRHHDLLIDFDPRFEQAFSPAPVLTLPIEHASTLSAALPPTAHHQYAVVIVDVTFLPKFSSTINEDVTKLATLLTPLHQPLRLILLGPQDLIENGYTGRDLNLKMAAVVPHTHTHHPRPFPNLGAGTSVRVFTTLAHSRRLHP